MDPRANRRIKPHHFVLAHLLRKPGEKEKREPCNREADQPRKLDDGWRAGRFFWLLGAALPPKWSWPTVLRPRAPLTGKLCNQLVNFVHQHRVIMFRIGGQILLKDRQVEQKRLYFSW